MKCFLVKKSIVIYFRIVKMEKQKEKRNRIIAIIPWALVIVLTSLNGFFVFHYFKTDKKLASTEEVLFSTDSAKNEIENILQQTQVELSNYQGKTAQLDSFLQQKDNDLKVYAGRIKQLLSQDRVSKDQLEKALEEIDQLRYYKRKYISQIDSLSGEIVLLNRENVNLRGNIDKQKRKNEDLNMEIGGLKTKVAIGAKLNTSNLNVTGIKLRGNGKERETMRVSQIQQIKVSFKIAENFVSDKGAKDIYLKITGPDGTTLYNQISGSGTFKFQGEESLYSSKKTINFTQDAQELSIYWDKGSEYSKGNYKAELYSDGFKIGAADFELK